MTASDRHSIGQSVIDACRAMTTLGVNHGTSGNGSARWLDGFLVTPTGMRYEDLKPADMVYVTLDGNAHGPLAPSSEWRMHCDIYRARPEMNAVLHAHPAYATALSCLREGIPRFHYMVAAAGGPDIRCADYALYGSADLSAAMIKALDGRKACLLANHGMIVCETAMQRALALAVEVEALARQYCIARQTGTPVLLTEAEMDEALARYADYGKQPGQQMRVEGTAQRPIRLHHDGWSVDIIDQTRLPHRLEIATLRTLDHAAHAITSMQVRGAPLIGATAAYGMALAMRADAGDLAMGIAADRLLSTRPTAVNLRWAVEEMLGALFTVRPNQRVEAAYRRAAEICEEDVAICHAIGVHGLTLIEQAAARKHGETINILTHCNAGWLACVDWGTATAPIYMAHDAGIPVHVWVDETRPRNQGASLTAWELGQHGVPHTLISDNSGGHLMQRGLVDLCIVGTDRTTATGDVANKIGTYLKALAAKDTGVPFYVALPSTTIDWTLDDGFAIPIEQRAGEELTQIAGRTKWGESVTISIAPKGTAVRNDAFDVTPARLVTGLITERGVADASRQGLATLFGTGAR